MVIKLYKIATHDYSALIGFFVASIALNIRNLNEKTTKSKIYRAESKTFIQNLRPLTFKDKSKKCINMQVSGLID